MLENVDVPIIIKTTKGGYINCKIKNIQKSTYKGSTGWSEMVLKMSRKELGKNIL